MASEQTQDYDSALVALLNRLGRGLPVPRRSGSRSGPSSAASISAASPCSTSAAAPAASRFLAETYRPAKIVGIDVDRAHRNSHAACECGWPC